MNTPADLSSQEAHRHRGVPEATAFSRAADAITPVPLLHDLVRIISPVELAAAGSAAALGGFLGQPAVDCKKSWKNRKFYSKLFSGKFPLKMLQAKSLAHLLWEVL
jgi:hypothetical protein